MPNRQRMGTPFFAGLLLLVSCTQPVEREAANHHQTTLETTPEEKAYWYNNEAEISSYELRQARYGELHKGHAVLIYVTEPFSPTKLVKSDQPSEGDVSVLKLNFTRGFTTGIYPYSVMTSTFFPFSGGEHSLKVTASSQEWCGHTYMELENRERYEVMVASYFEGESKERWMLPKTHLEDDFWTLVRLDPEKIPTGTAKVIPSFFYQRTAHVEAGIHECEITRGSTNDSVDSLALHYPELDRRVVMHYESAFPHRILSWEETHFSGWGENRKKLTTTARLVKTIKSDYWNRNHRADSALRDTLGLD